MQSPTNSPIGCALVDFAREVERRLRPIDSLLVAAAGGGRDTNGHALPCLAERLQAVPATLAALARWASENSPQTNQR
jgi:hypothetical protein